MGKPLIISDRTIGEIVNLCKSQEENILIKDEMKECILTLDTLINFLRIDMKHSDNYWELINKFNNMIQDCYNNNNFTKNGDLFDFKYRDKIYRKKVTCSKGRALKVFVLMNSTGTNGLSEISDLFNINFFIGFDRETAKDCDCILTNYYDTKELFVEYKLPIYTSLKDLILYWF